MAETCEDRIESHLNNRLDDWRVFANVQNDAELIDAETKTKAEALGIEFTDDPCDAEDSAWEVVREYPLDISSNIVYRIDISTGGPADWLEVWTDNVEDSGFYGNGIEKIIYHFADWFDHAEVQLFDEAFDVAESFVNNFFEF